jgi:hypothetical protein
MRTALRVGLVVGWTALLGPHRADCGEAPDRSPVLATPHFAFYSRFDANLNDALIAAGLARKNGKPELFRAGTEAACFEKLPKSLRAAWNEAVDYYAEIVSPGGFGRSEQFRVRLQLAGFDDELTKDEDREYVGIVASFRAVAAPAYRACRWPAQDEANRRWIDAVKPSLSAHEATAAARLAQLYGKPWGGLPIPVDVVQTVDWSGANSILHDPSGGHILISVENEGATAFEVVFHESSHLFMRRDDPLQKALDGAASSAGFPLPRDLWHVVLFYTTGEVVRTILDDGGKPEYKPMLYVIFERGSWSEYRVPLENTWRPYLDGKRTMSEAATDLIAALQHAAKLRPGGAEAGHD